MSSLIDSNLVPVGPDTPLDRITRYFALYNLVALPVVDEQTLRDWPIGTTNEPFPYVAPPAEPKPTVKATPGKPDATAVKH